MEKVLPIHYHRKINKNWFSTEGGVQPFCNLIPINILILVYKKTHRVFVMCVWGGVGTRFPHMQYFLFSVGIKLTLYPCLCRVLRQSARRQEAKPRVHRKALTDTGRATARDWHPRAPKCCSPPSRENNGFHEC